MIEDKEFIAYSQMTRQQQKDYIAMLVRSAETHIKTAELDEQAGYHYSALCHQNNAISDLESVKGLLSEVIYNDIIGELGIVV